MNHKDFERPFYGGVFMLIEALEFLKIDANAWDSKTAEERKSAYRKTIRSALLTYHPDRNPGLEESDPALFKEHERIIRLLTDIKYENASRGPEQEIPKEEAGIPQEEADAADLGAPPKSSEAFLRDFKHFGMAYYRTYKFLIPSVVKSQDIEKLREIFIDHYDAMEMRARRRGKESTRLPDEQEFSDIWHLILTYFFLKGYKGADKLVTAMAKNNQSEIKQVFDDMVRSLKRQWFGFSFHKMRPASLASFIDEFCRFYPTKGGTGVYEGIKIESVDLLFKSLKLNLPLHILDVKDPEDQKFVRSVLTNYVNSVDKPLALDDKPQAAAIKGSRHP